MLRLKSVIHNPLKAVCLFRGARSLVDSTTLVTGDSTKLGMRIRSHYILLALSAVLFVLCAMPLSVSHAAIATLAWNANDEPDLEGYVIYRNTNYPGPPYSYSDTLPEDELDDPLHPEVKLTGLQNDKEYYIALTAYNTNGDESSFSNEICATVVNNTIRLCNESSSPPVTTSSSGVSGGGSSSWACFISAASHSPSDKNLLLYILLAITAIVLGTYGYKTKASKQ